MILTFRILLPLQLSFISRVARYTPSSRQALEQNNVTNQYQLILNTCLSVNSNREWKRSKQLKFKPHESLFGVLREIPLHDPCVISWVVPQYVHHWTAFVFAEIDDRHFLVVENDASCQVYIVVAA